MSAEMQKVDVLADLQRLLDLSESTSDADTGCDATFIPVPTEAFIATVRRTSAALAELIEVARAIEVETMDYSPIRPYSAESHLPVPFRERLRAALARIGGAA